MYECNEVAYVERAGAAVAREVCGASVAGPCESSDLSSESNAGERSSSSVHPCGTSRGRAPPLAVQGGSESPGVCVQRAVVAARGQKDRAPERHGWARGVWRRNRGASDVPALGSGPSRQRAASGACGGPVAATGPRTTPSPSGEWGARAHVLDSMEGARRTAHRCTLVPSHSQTQTTQISSLWGWGPSTGLGLLHSRLGTTATVQAHAGTEGRRVQRHRGRGRGEADNGRVTRQTGLPSAGTGARPGRPVLPSGPARQRGTPAAPRSGWHGRPAAQMRSTWRAAGPLFLLRAWPLFPPSPLLHPSPTDPPTHRPTTPTTPGPARTSPTSAPPRASAS